MRTACNAHSSPSQPSDASTITAWDSRRSRKPRPMRRAISSLRRSSQGESSDIRLESLNGRLRRTVLAAALAGSLLGFDTAVVSGATHPLTLTFQLSPAQLSVTVSAALWGTVVGAMGAGLMGRHLG